MVAESYSNAKALAAMKNSEKKRATLHRIQPVCNYVFSSFGLLLP